MNITIVILFFLFQVFSRAEWQVVEQFGFGEDISLENLEGWAAIRSRSTVSLKSSQCGSDFIIGGYLDWFQVEVSKMFNLSPHSAIKIELNLIMLDNWEGDGQIEINILNCVTDSIFKPFDDSYENICGLPQQDAKVYGNIYEFPHIDDSLILVFRDSQSSPKGSWGIQGFRLSIFNQNQKQKEVSTFFSTKNQKLKQQKLKDFKNVGKEGKGSGL